MKPIYEPKGAAKKNENGCKYCRDGDVIVLDSCSAVRIERDGQNYIMAGCDWEHEINYCPMCGRQLRHSPKDVQYDDLEANNEL